MAASPRTTLSYSYYYYYIWRRRRRRRDVYMYIPELPPPTTLSPNAPPDHPFAKASSSWWEGGEKLLWRTRPHPAPFAKTLANLYIPKPPPPPMSTTILSGTEERLFVYTYCMIHNIQGGLDVIRPFRRQWWIFHVLTCSIRGWTFSLTFEDIIPPSSLVFFLYRFVFLYTYNITIRRPSALINTRMIVLLIPRKSYILYYYIRSEDFWATIYRHCKYYNIKIC